MAAAVRPALALALLPLLLPHAAALGEVVDLVSVAPPERTLADRPFEAEATLRNKAAEARTVLLLAALYAPDANPCGPATGPGFRQFTHLVQERIPLAPGETRVVKAWAHAYRASSVQAAPAEAEWCAFVAEDAGERIEYLDYERVPLPVRGVNAAPTADFTWTPREPRATQDVTFQATGRDADGDPVTFRWDFGHANASGRRPVEGAVAGHFYYPEGAYVVTLTVSDGLDEAVVTRTLTVLPEAAPPEDRDAPLPLILPLAALALAGLARARRPRCP